MTGRTCRVAWVPGTDVLHGTCHCSAEFLTDDPVDLWTWMDTHPHLHRPLRAVARPDPVDRQSTGVPS